MKQTNQIVERTRNRKGQPNGVLVARKINKNNFVIGWSLCSKADNFDMNTGVNIALGRSLQRDYDVPNSLTKSLVKFEARCQRYFKGCKLT